MAVIKKAMFEHLLDKHLHEQCIRIQEAVKINAKRLADTMGLQLRDLDAKVTITWKCEIK